MKVELIMENPMTGGCRCSVSMTERMALVKAIRERAQVWEKVKKGNTGHEFSRSVVSDRDPDKVPRYVKAALDVGSQLPYVYLDSELVHSGSYPTVEIFLNLLSGGEQNT